MIFSPSTIGFYDPDMKAEYEAAGTWPSDGVEISAADWTTYSGDQPEGKTLGAVNGKPAWVDVSTTPSSIIDSTELLTKRLTAQELGILASNASTLPLLITCAAAKTIDLSDAQVIAGFNSLVPDLMTQARVTEILTP